MSLLICCGDLLACLHFFIPTFVLSMQKKYIWGSKTSAEVFQTELFSVDVCTACPCQDACFPGFGRPNRSSWPDVCRDIRPKTSSLGCFLAVKKHFFGGNFGRWKAFRKLPVRNFKAAREGLRFFPDTFRIVYSDPFSRLSSHFPYRLTVFRGRFRSADVPP